MKKTAFALISATALVALSACAESEPADEAAVADTQQEVDVDLPDTPAVPATPAAEDGDGDRVSINEDGVSADINDGDTSVRADIDGDPSLEVEVD